MRNSFELLDWLKQHLGGGGGGAADVPLADSVTPGNVRLTHEVSREEAEHTAVSPDGVAAYVDGGFVPLKAEATAEIGGITNSSTTGSAKCIQGSTGLLVTLNLNVTAKPNEGIVTFPLHDARFSTARFLIYAAGGAYVVSGANGNLTIYATAVLSGKSMIDTITVPYF